MYAEKPITWTEIEKRGILDMKKPPLPKQIHTAKTDKNKPGSGDYYGTGVRNPTGKSRDVTGMGILPAKSSKKPPRSLA